MKDNIKYMLPPAGMDGRVPVYQTDNEMRTEDYLLYLKGVADTTGWICLSGALMEEIADNYRSIKKWGDHRRFENDRLKESVERYAKKLKELRKASQ